MNDAIALCSAVFDRYGFPLLLVLVPLLFWLQLRYPLRKRVQSIWKRLWINVALSLPAFGLLRLAFIPLMVWLAFRNEQQWHFGLNHLYVLPAWIEGVIAFAALDWAIYCWHFLTHRIPVLWRFHIVHHTDLDLDVITAFRFHFGELMLSAIFRGASVVLAGASPLLVLVYEIIFECCTNFHHSNLKLPLRLERWINYIIVTPRMHGIHHSIVSAERDSNWGTIFSFWDRLHRTANLEIPQDSVVIGEATHQDPAALTAGNLLLMPFRGKGQKRGSGRKRGRDRSDTGAGPG